MKILLIFALIFVSAVVGFGQTKSTPMPPENPPGGIELIFGYSHIRRRGIDSRVGDISKPDGLTIRYDIGLMAGVNPDMCARKNDCLWYKRQMINGREVWIGLSKEGKVFATFPKENANFYADTKSPEEMTDFLIMVLTYKVKEPFIEKAADKPKQK